MGATFVVKVPDIGEGVVEAELVGWNVKVGDLVQEDQVVAEVMTDKATVEIPAPLAGTVVALGGEVGAKLVVGGELLRLEAPAAGKPVNGAQPTPLASAEPAASDAPAPPAAAEQPPATSPPRKSALAAPAVRQRARALGLDLAMIAGSGPDGRILHADLDALLRRQAQPAQNATAAPAQDAVQEIPVLGLRRRIAERMAEATRRVAHFSYVEEVDLTALEALRATLNAEWQQRGRPRLTPLPFLMRAVVRAVAEFPQMNALYDDEAGVIRRHAPVHIGIATQAEAGLMVPVVRHAESRGLWDCAAEVARLAAAVRDGSAGREALSGSTITLTSLGALGGIASTPVVNVPEVAIIGTSRMQIRPVWRDGQGVVPRMMMNLCSSFDHRVVDGHDAAAFIQRIKALLETPALLFVEPG